MRLLCANNFRIDLKKICIADDGCCEYKKVGGVYYHLFDTDKGAQTQNYYGCKDDCIYVK